MTVHVLRPAKQGASRLYPHYVLGVLCLANIFNIADRNIMPLLLEPIKAELHASDTAMSLLTGASFVVFYSLFGIPIASLSDRGNRRNILAIGVALWSIMTAACGMAANFPQMALARAGVGIGEATGTPTSVSMIADYYSRKLRPQMLSVFNLAVPLGSILVTPLIGLITDAYNWRTAFLALGIPGLLVAVLVRFTVREPVRGAMDESRSDGAEDGHRKISDAFRVMFKSRPFVLILVGTALVQLGGSTLGAWGPAMMMRVFKASPTQVAGIAGPLIAIAALVGTIAGGMMTTWLANTRKSERWLVLAPALASVLTVPAGLLFVWAPSFGWMIFAAMIGAGTMAFRTSPYLALSLDLVPANCRGMAAALTVIAVSVVGQAGGPLVVGMISDALTPSLGAAEALRRGFLFAPLMLAVGLIPFFMALKEFDANGVKPKA